MLFSASSPFVKFGFLPQIQGGPQISNSAFHLWASVNLWEITNHGDARYRQPPEPRQAPKWGRIWFSLKIVCSGRAGNQYHRVGGDA